MRVGDLSTLGRFQSLSGCGAHLIVGGGAPVAAAAMPEGTAVVRIIGVQEQKTARKPVAKSRTHKVTLKRPPAFDREIRTVAARYKIDPLFLHAMVDTESGYKPEARSRVGALGLMQIMPATGAGLGVDRLALLSPAANLDAGARHLKQLQKRYGHKFDLILSAYNAGAGAVERYGNKVPPYAETQAYVVKVMNRYGALRTGFTRAKLLSSAR
ncbi:lytic transglycosylase domain-containing protein [Novosphingobium sp. RD2P27]|uniref:Lytic transglycosylase domain-containing protein n=1 Tax=Novosphingobium kalidii TaxID=3230299 RepID=A0ABV2D1Q0_9SPHN